MQLNHQEVLWSTFHVGILWGFSEHSLHGTIHICLTRFSAGWRELGWGVLPPPGKVPKRISLNREVLSLWAERGPTFPSHHSEGKPVPSTPLVGRNGQKRIRPSQSANCCGRANSEGSASYSAQRWSPSLCDSGPIMWLWPSRLSCGCGICRKSGRRILMQGDWLVKPIYLGSRQPVEWKDQCQKQVGWSGVRWMQNWPSIQEQPKRSGFLYIFSHIFDLILSVFISLVRKKWDRFSEKRK